MIHKQAMRDGTTGFEWHVGRLSRCMVHLLRNSEDFAMQKGLGTQECMRHTEFQGAYGEYKDAMKRVLEMAAGPLTCASQLGKIRKIPGRYDFAKEAISKLIDRGNMIM